MKNTTAIYDNGIDYLLDQAIDNMATQKPKRKFKQYALYDSNNNLLAIGKYGEIMTAEHPRYVYRHIFTDYIVFTGNYIDKDNNIID